MTKPSPEMVERARAWLLSPENHPSLVTANRTPTEDEIQARLKSIRDGWSILQITAHGLAGMLAAHALSEVQNAVRECAPFLEHDEECPSDIGDGDLCDCGLSALRQKFGVCE